MISKDIWLFYLISFHFFITNRKFEIYVPEKYEVAKFSYVPL